MFRRFVALAVVLVCAASALGQEKRSTAVHDLTLLVDARLPCVWPTGMSPFLIAPSQVRGPGAYHRDLLHIDEHTGTQWDAPAHFVPPPGSGLPGAGPMGLLTGEKVAAWQFVGEACVLDLRAFVDKAANGQSFLITPDLVQAWERQHRSLSFGDVVLFYSGYSDRYYLPLAKGGERFVHTALRKDTPAWPAPTPECMKYLGGKGVMALAIDSPSMGPVGDMAVTTHQAGGQLGMIWTECATNLGSLPPTGSAYFLLAAKHAGGSGSEARALAVSEPTLAKRLIASAKAKRVTDLSVTLDEEYPVTWPGARAGDEAPRYLGKTLNSFSKQRGPFFARTHSLDSQAGTHLVPPSFSLPPKGFDVARYGPDVQQTLKIYESKFGPLGASDETVEQVPLTALMGDAHVIDVKQLIGTTTEKHWPASPAITVEMIKEHEQKVRPIKKGEVVIFASGYVDQHFKPLPETPNLDRLMTAPLAGKAEGWPAPTPEAIVYLAQKGVRCIATDGPTLGGADPRQALLVNWAAASRGVYVVEYLTNVAALPQEGAFFVFAPIKIAGAHGGYGRALGLY